MFIGSYVFPYDIMLRLLPMLKALTNKFFFLSVFCSNCFCTRQKQYILLLLILYRAIDKECDLVNKVP